MRAFILISHQPARRLPLRPSTTNANAQPDDSNDPVAAIWHPSPASAAWPAQIKLSRCASALTSAPHPTRGCFVHNRWRASTATAAARKKTEDMTEEEKAAETALNQQLLVAKGVLFLG